MTQAKIAVKKYAWDSLSYPRHAKAIHFGLAVFGITAYLTAELAEADINTWGYLIHAYLGFGLGLCITLRPYPLEAGHP